MEINIKLPSDVKYILNKLEENEHTAYVVGGCVRDTILGREPKDWDIASSATPVEVTSIFSDDKVISSGEKYGTVTIIIGDDHYEVTTYRNDSVYSDGRRPDSVTYSTNIVDDLQRRDFTINAIAYNETNGFVDPFNGMVDLSNGIIRLVGDSEDRIKEDALRMVRAIRFAARYKFNIHNLTELLIIRNMSLLSNVSNERLSKELREIIDNLENVMYGTNAVIFKLFITQIIPEFIPTIGFDQRNPHHDLTVFAHIMKSCCNCYGDVPFEIKMCMFLHDIGKPETFSLGEDGVGHFYGHAERSAEIARDVLTRLRFSKKEIDTICILIKHHDRPVSLSVKSMKRSIYKFGVDIIQMILDVRSYDILAQSMFNANTKLKQIIDAREVLEKVKNSGDCVSFTTLSINGDDIMESFDIVPGKLVKTYLNMALAFVMENPEKNTKLDIIEYLSSVSPDYIKNPQMKEIFNDEREVR